MENKKIKPNLSQRKINLPYVGLKNFYTPNLGFEQLTKSGLKEPIFFMSIFCLDDYKKEYL